MLLSVVVQHDLRDASLFTLNIMQNVTERKRVQSQLAEQYERLRATLHSIGDAVITAAITNLGNSMAFFDSTKGCGIRFALDDFW